MSQANSQKLKSNQNLHQINKLKAQLKSIKEAHNQELNQLQTQLKYHQDRLSKYEDLYKKKASRFQFIISDQKINIEKKQKQINQLHIKIKGLQKAQQILKQKLNQKNSQGIQILDESYYQCVVIDDENTNNHRQINRQTKHCLCDIKSKQIEIMSEKIKSLQLQIINKEVQAKDIFWLSQNLMKKTKQFDILNYEFKNLKQKYDGTNNKQNNQQGAKKTENINEQQLTTDHTLQKSLSGTYSGWVQTSKGFSQTYQLETQSMVVDKKQFFLLKTYIIQISNQRNQLFQLNSQLQNSLQYLID